MRPDTPSAGPRILLLRSGRHLRVAIDALTARYPGCHVGVVGTPGSEAALAAVDLAPEDCFIYRAPRIEPLRFVFSRTALAIRRWRYDRIAILWNDPDGTGQGNVDRAALAMSPRGYVAIAPDGTIVERSLGPQVRAECLRLFASLGVGAVLGALLYLPALALIPFTTMARRSR